MKEFKSNNKSLDIATIKSNCNKISILEQKIYPQPDLKPMQDPILPDFETLWAGSFANYGLMDINYLDRIDAVKAKDIDELRWDEVLTYMTFILRADRFNAGCYLRAIEDGTMERLGRRLVKALQEDNDNA